jgi:hypothetical protein
VSPKLSYAVGDACWISLGTKDLAAAKVVGTFATPNHPTTFYICELIDNDWPHLEIRDALLMSPEEGKPLTFWEFTANKQKPNADIAPH